MSEAYGSRAGARESLAEGSPEALSFSGCFYNVTERTGQKDRHGCRARLTLKATLAEVWGAGFLRSWCTARRLRASSR